MKMSQESLDKLEELFINQLLDPEGGVPAAKLDQMRKILEKNNRLYLKPTARDPRPVLDSIDDEEMQGCILPFAKKRG